MDHLPTSDINMLVSSINFLLRDKEFDNLDQICENYGISRDEMDKKLAEGGFTYSEQYNKVY